VATANVTVVDVALGFRPHTGWTVAVAIGGDVASPRVLERRMIALTDEDQVPAQLYHAAAELQPASAEALVRRAEAIVTDVTEREVADFVVELRLAGHMPVIAGIATTATGQGHAYAGDPDRGPGDIAYILAAHMRMHAAEGELYGEALAEALDKAGLAVTRVHPRDVAAVAVHGLQRDADALQRIVTALGMPLGPPVAQGRERSDLAGLVRPRRAALTESLINSQQ
jgi:hypothetical protein